jgi:2Fe-2S ferredoxin
MTRLTFVQPDGARREFTVDAPTTAMQVARLNDVPGIEAECGGALSCGTCHVYVDEADRHRLPEPSEDERGMLELVAAERRPGSRLCCQLALDGRLADLVLHVPTSQF